MRLSVLETACSSKERKRDSRVLRIVGDFLPSSFCCGVFMPPFHPSRGKGLEGDASTALTRFPRLQQGNTDDCEHCPHAGGEQGQGFSVRGAAAGSQGASVLACLKYTENSR